MRQRIHAHFTDLRHQRQTIEADLAALASDTGRVNDIDLLDELPELAINSRLARASDDPTSATTPPPATTPRQDSRVSCVRETADHGMNRDGARLHEIKWTK